jgi:glycosyltransferase involved in cell wall biosynthesis
MTTAMRNTGSEPLVSVLTPVYNGADYLSECIESVLGQTYGHFEYIIVNNCSSDGTLDIAMSYARRDPRVRVHSNDTFVEVIENHNRAFGLVSSASEYCKVVSADDFLFPECLERMVGLAEGNRSVGIVGSYQLSGKIVRWQGFEYPKPVFPGREICRRIFIDIAAVPRRVCHGQQGVLPEPIAALRHERVLRAPAARRFRIRVSDPVL